MVSLATPHAIVWTWSALKQCCAAVGDLHATIKETGLKNLYQQKWKDIQSNMSVSNGKELLQLIAREIHLSIRICAFEFAVQYGLLWLGKKMAPYVFAPSIANPYGVDEISRLMARHTHLDCAEVILFALEYAPDNLRAELFAKSVRVHSSYYTEKLIPPVVSKDGIVALIQHNNIPVLAKILKKEDLSFLVAASAVLGQQKLLDTFEQRVELSEVVHFIDVEKWANYQVDCYRHDQDNLIAQYQGKLLNRAIHHEISQLPSNQDIVRRRKI